MRLRSIRCLYLVFAALLLAAGCTDGDPPVKDPLPLSRVAVDRTYLRDAHGRYTFVHGVNVSCTTKVPAAVDARGIPTYVGRPFARDKAAEEFRRIRELGFNTIRLLVIWEGVEPEGRGVYDREYLAYLREMVQLAGQHDLYVLMDMHQDLFSRHLVGKFNAKPRYGAPGSVEHALLSLVQSKEGYTDALQGDGAPRWAVQACLQEKKMDSPFWGTPRLLGGMDAGEALKLWQLYQKLTGQAQAGGPPPSWVTDFVLGLPGKFDVDESTDVLPFTNWGIAHTLSLDGARCYACLFAGDKVFPGLVQEGMNIKDYLQEAYANAWAEVAQQVADQPNVIGYDLMNEPGGNFITLSAAAGLIKTGAVGGARDVLASLLGPELGPEVFDALITLKLIPPDTTPETLRKWGLDKIDTFALLGLNNAFDETYMRPFYERVGRAILAKDKDALLFIEGTMNASALLGANLGGGIWEFPMQHPAGLDLRDRVVYAPHWYADIYPFIGFNMDPRRFDAEQVRHRDYRPKLEEAAALAAYSLGNVPVVFGEFGTYYNFNNTYEEGKHLDRARADEYQVSAQFLDNYYEAFEGMFASRILWCYSTENDPEKGDLWNREDFSLLGPDGKPRAQEAWGRPFARALAGKPIATHYYSDLHYFDPDKGVPDPRHEFEVRYASKESAAPSEISVPRAAYPDGFYVWVSDGVCHYDAQRAVLYHHPGRDEPGTEHWVRLRPPLRGEPNRGWSYFFKGDQLLGGR